MKKLLIWAVLCAVGTGFAMDASSYDQYPPSPGKIASDEDLKRLLQVTRSHSPEDFPSASSSPIPADDSQEQITAAAASPERVQNVQDFQTQFKQWIDTENIVAFRGFLKEHYGDAEKYMSEEIVAYASHKKETSKSDQSQEIYEMLNYLTIGGKYHLGDMEKIWHHNSLDYEPEFELLTDPKFFQQKSLLNIALRDLIEQQKLDDIIDIVHALTENNNCYLADVISDKTVEVAYQKMLSEQTETAEIIYSIINSETDDIPAIDPDTTAESLERTLYAEMDKAVLTKKGKQAIVRSKLFTWIENSDLDGVTQFCGNYESDAQVAKHISHEILKNAEIIRDRVTELQKFLYHETGHKLARNAHAIWQKLHQVVHNPCPVSYILSDEEEKGPIYSEGQLDTQKVQNRLKHAFSFSTLESILGSEKAEKIIQLLNQENKEKKRGELDWISPASSPSDGLREYLGSFKPESLSD